MEFNLTADFLIRAITGLIVSLMHEHTIRDLANLFSVTPRAIQNHVALGQVQSRNLFGRAKFLSEDIEDFLIASKKKASRGK